MKLPKCLCRRCGHRWTPRVPRPASCPKCRNPRWQEPRAAKIAAALLIAASVIGSCDPAQAFAAERGTASWYSVASCRREGSSGIMANGAPLNDAALTAASWRYPFGTRLRVRSGARSVIVTVCDRGPARRLARRGRVIDLARAAFLALAPLSAGVIPVTVERL